jgi:hypothetical protein
MTHDEDRPEQMGSEFAQRFIEGFRKQLDGSMWGRSLFGNIVEQSTDEAGQKFMAGFSGDTASCIELSPDEQHMKSILQQYVWSIYTDLGISLMAKDICARMKEG